MSAIDFIGIPAFRTPEDNSPDWSGTVQQHLQRENPTLGKSQKVVDAFKSMASNRKLIASTCNESTQPTDNRVTEGFIQGPIKEYLQLLRFAQSHLPLSSGAIKGLTFAWKATNGSKKTTKQTSPNSMFEVCNVLSVAANCYVRVAQREIALNGVEGAKAAYKLFQNAAGLSEHVDTLLKHFPPTDRFGGDMSDAGNEQLTKLYLAYAHHAAQLKVELESPTKYSLLSKLAMEGANTYAAVSSLAKRCIADGRVTTKDMPLDVADTAAFAGYILKAKANFFLAQELIAKDAYGEGIGRCNNALDALNLANQLVNSVSREERNWLNTFRVKVDTFADKAVNDNSTLHWDRVAKNLPDPEAIGKPMGKPTPYDQVMSLNTTGTNAKMTDPFFGIIPLHVLDKVNQYRNKVRETVQNISESVASHKNRTRAALQAQNVHSAIQVATSDNQNRGLIPPSLRKRILEIRGITDPAQQARYNDLEEGKQIEQLVEKFDHINNVVEFCHNRIRDVLAKLANEEHEDAVKREAYGAKVWGEIRKPLREHPDGKAIYGSIDEYNAAIAKYVDEPLQRAKSLLQANLRDACTIDWPLEDLNKLMPFAKSTEAKHSSEAAMAQINKLQAILKQIDENDAAEQTKIDDLRALIESDEIAHLLSSTPAEQHDQLLETSRRALADRLSLITAHMNATDELVAEADAAMTTYATLQSTDAITNEVQAVCNTIMESINLYEVILQDANDIGKFVDTVSEQIEATASAAESLILTRSMEMEELVVSLDGQVAAKIQEMHRQEAIKSEADQSRAKQEELRARLAALEAGRQGSHPPTSGNPHPTSGGPGHQQPYGSHQAPPATHQAPPAAYQYNQPPPQPYQQPPPPQQYQQPVPQQPYGYYRPSSGGPPQGNTFAPGQPPAPMQAPPTGFHQPMPAYPPNTNAPQWAPNMPPQQLQPQPNGQPAYPPTQYSYPANYTPQFNV